MRAGGHHAAGQPLGAPGHHAAAAPGPDRAVPGADAPASSDPACGELRAAAQAASRMKGTVGTTGRNRPTMPAARLTAASAASSASHDERRGARAQSVAGSWSTHGALCGGAYARGMAVREILKMGDPRLLRVAQPVAAFDTDELHLLVRDMFDTMHAVNGAGLAAPQIGVDLQLVIFGTDAAEPALPRRAARAAHRAAQSGHHADRRRRGRGLGGLPVRARPARRGAALGDASATPASTRTATRSTARSRASMPAWCSTSATTCWASCTRCGCATSRKFGYTEVLFPGLDAGDDD